jgi:hypothetical protein
MGIIGQNKLKIRSVTQENKIHLILIRLFCHKLYYNGDRTLYKDKNETWTTMKSDLKQTAGCLNK